MVVQRARGIFLRLCWVVAAVAGLIVGTGWAILVHAGLLRRPTRAEPGDAAPMR